MPQIAEQESVLNGRGRVLLYANGTGEGNWYYKEKVKGEKRTKELTDIEFGSKKGNPETISLFDE
tara:strand:- start:219 stop:413 length:195 start_codon:yes stop_codon:yes gene_type:complete